MPTSAYIGRFCPTPSGALDFCSRIAACASSGVSLSPKCQRLVRIDDLDTPRVQPGAINHILHTLEAFGFEWHQNIIYQSQRLHAYQQALDTLLSTQAAFACRCTRKQLFSRRPDGIYDGYCRHKYPTLSAHEAVRFNLEPFIGEDYAFNDAIQGHMTLDLTATLGDFILRRSDGFFGYQLACAVDDSEQGITHVVRGSDLLHSAVAQSLVLRALQRPLPEYAHHPIALTADGIKLSKSAQSPAIEIKHAPQLIWQALHFLGQQPARELQQADIQTLWDWAKTHWQRDAIPRKISQEQTV